MKCNVDYALAPRRLVNLAGKSIDFISIVGGMDEVGHFGIHSSSFSSQSPSQNGIIQKGHIDPKLKGRLSTGRRSESLMKS